MSTGHSTNRSVLSVAVVAYIYGLILGLCALAWYWFSGEGLPDWKWWHYLLAPLGIGLAALALEGIGTLITKGDDVKHPLWKRSARMLVLVLFGLIVVFGPALYKIAHP